MGGIQLKNLINDVLHAESQVTQSKKAYGKDSPQYASAVDRFKKLWRMLSLSRKPEDFVPVVKKQD